MRFIKVPAAKTPVRATELSAGYDLFAMMSYSIMPGCRMLIRTGVYWEPSSIADHHSWGQICPRSGLAFRQGLDVMAGVIDCDYKDEIKVLLINHSDNLITIEAGDACAQLVIQQYQTMADEALVLAKRDGGFGSTDGTKGQHEETCGL